MWLKIAKAGPRRFVFVAKENEIGCLRDCFDNRDQLRAKLADNQVYGNFIPRI